MTFLAPALAANIDRIPVPQPTSRTTLSLNRCLLCHIELRYLKHRQDTRAAADVKDDLVLEQVLVVPHRVAVAQ